MSESVESRTCGCSAAMVAVVLQGRTVYVCDGCDPGAADQMVAADIERWQRETGGGTPRGGDDG